MECYRCGKTMTHTPMCAGCGVLPVADAVLARKDKQIAEMEAERRAERIQWDNQHHELTQRISHLEDDLSRMTANAEHERLRANRAETALAQA